MADWNGMRLRALFKKYFCRPSHVCPHCKKMIDDKELKSHLWFEHREEVLNELRRSPEALHL